MSDIVAEAERIVARAAADALEQAKSRHPSTLIDWHGLDYGVRAEHNGGVVFYGPLAPSPRPAMAASNHTEAALPSGSPRSLRPGATGRRVDAAPEFWWSIGLVCAAYAVAAVVAVVKWRKR